MNFTFVFFVIILLLLLSFLHFVSKPPMIHEHFESESQSSTVDAILSTEQVDEIKEYLSDETFDELIQKNNGETAFVECNSDLEKLVHDTKSTLIQSLKNYFRYVFNATKALYEEEVQGDDADTLKNRITDLVSAFKKYRDSSNKYFYLFDSILKKVKEKKYFNREFGLSDKEFFEERVAVSDDGDQESAELSLPSQVLRFSQKPNILPGKLVYDITIEYINIMPDTGNSKQLLLKALIITTKISYTNMLNNKSLSQNDEDAKDIRDQIKDLERKSLSVQIDEYKFSENTKLINDQLQRIPDQIRNSN